MTRPYRFRLAVVGALLFALFIAIGFLQPTGLFAPLDQRLMQAAGEGRSAFAGSAVTTLMVALSVIGDTIGRLFLMLGVCAWLYRRKRVRAALWLIGAVVGMTLINTGLKGFFQAARPELIPHLDPVATYSFPSGHASGNMAFFGAIALLLPVRPVIITAAVMIVLIGISRVWLGVHWPSDVVAGWMAGAAWLSFWCTLLPFADRRGRT
jgi:undecaprenyl-diphosphatase